MSHLSPHTAGIYCGPAMLQALAMGWLSGIRPDLGPHRALEFSSVDCLSHTVFPQILALFPSSSLGDRLPSASGVQDSSSYE